MTAGVSARLPVIGIPLRGVTAWGVPPAPVLWQYRSNLTAITRGGGVPLPLPPLNDPEHLRRLYDLCDGVLLTGGPDVDPGRYGQRVLPDHGVYTEAELDRAELLLARWAVDDDLPLLGVCRGAQVLATSRGGSLWQDIDHQAPSPGMHRSSPDGPTTYHDIEVSAGSRLASIVGDGRLRVNSRHHQAVRDPGEGLRVCARSPDGVIEALELPGMVMTLGVQWHPEEMTADPASQALFSALVDAARAPALVS